MIVFDILVCYHKEPWAPCVDYYHCEHCQAKLRGKECDLDHVDSLYSSMVEQHAR